MVMSEILVEGAVLQHVIGDAQHASDAMGSGQHSCCLVFGLDAIMPHQQAGSEGLEHCILHSPSSDGLPKQLTET